MTLTCPHAARCSGCTLLGVEPGEQLARKRARVLDEFSAYPSLRGLQADETAGAEPAVGYRTRAKWMAGPGGELGLYARGEDHRVVDIPGCLVVAPALERVGQAVRSWLASSERWRGALRAVDLRELRRGGESRVLLTLVVPEGAAVTEGEARAAAAALAAAAPGVLGVALNVSPAQAPQVLGPSTTLLWGEREGPDEIAGATILATFGSFVQAHRGQAGRIAEAIARRARGRVLELYGGSGALALSLARRGLDVTTVESFAPAADAARRAAAAQKLSLRVETGDAGQVASSMAGETFDLVILNPPRRGVSPDVRWAPLRLNAAAVAYVSCEPRTLARDLDHLARLGFQVESVAPHDMIPLTDEVETLVFLRRGPPPPPPVLLDAGTALFVAKGPHEPTTPQGEYPLSLLDRVRLLPGWGAAVPVHRLDAGTSGVCLFARSPAEVRPWSLALTAGQKVYLAAARGVTSSRGVINRPLREQGRAVEARTRYRRSAVVAGHSLLEVRPEQGRQHQIRRHLAGIGHPLLGDERYGHEPTNRHFFEKYGLDRCFLHCASIELTHPLSGAPLLASCPPPADLPLLPRDKPGRTP